MSKTCSSLTTKTPEQHHWRRFGVFIVNFEQILNINLVFPLFTLNKYMPARSLIKIIETYLNGTNLKTF